MRAGHACVTSSQNHKCCKSTSNPISSSRIYPVGDEVIGFADLAVGCLDILTIWGFAALAPVVEGLQITEQLARLGRRCVRLQITRRAVCALDGASTSIFLNHKVLTIRWFFKSPV